MCKRSPPQRTMRPLAGVFAGLILLGAPWQLLPASQPYAIEIFKANRTLLVRQGDEIQRAFPVAWGRGGAGDKQRMGDKRTPVGVYRIMDFNESSNFHLFMQLNYPNVKDAFWGWKNKVISDREFDQIIAALRRGALPPQNTALGGAIGIHGLGEINDEKLHIQRNVNWTEGCIALTNTDVDALRAYVQIGTRVDIRE